MINWLIRPNICSASGDEGEGGGDSGGAATGEGVMPEQVQTQQQVPAEVMATTGEATEQVQSQAADSTTTAADGDDGGSEDVTTTPEVDAALHDDGAVEMTEATGDEAIEEVAIHQDVVPQVTNNSPIEKAVPYEEPDDSSSDEATDGDEGEAIEVANPPKPEGEPHTDDGDDEETTAAAATDDIIGNGGGRIGEVDTAMTDDGVGGSGPKVDGESDETTEE